MGVLFLRAKQSLALGDHEIALTRTVASAMAIALRNARVLQSLRDQTQQVTVARFEAERRLRSLQRYADFFELGRRHRRHRRRGGASSSPNPKARAISMYDEVELRGRKLGELFPEDDAERLTALRSGFAKGSYPQAIDLPHPRRGDGAVLTLSVNFNSVLREEGAVLCSFRDVTEEPSRSPPS